MPVARRVRLPLVIAPVQRQKLQPLVFGSLQQPLVAVRAIDLALHQLDADKEAQLLAVWQPADDGAGGAGVFRHRSERGFGIDGEQDGREGLQAGDALPAFGVRHRHL